MVRTGFRLHISSSQKFRILAFCSVCISRGSLCIPCCTSGDTAVAFHKRSKSGTNILFIQMLSSIENYNKFGLKISKPHGYPCHFTRIGTRIRHCDTRRYKICRSNTMLIVRMKFENKFEHNRKKVIGAGNIA